MKLYGPGREEGSECGGESSESSCAFWRYPSVPFYLIARTRESCRLAHTHTNQLDTIQSSLCGLEQWGCSMILSTSLRQEPLLCPPLAFRPNRNSLDVLGKDFEATLSSETRSTGWVGCLSPLLPYELHVVYTWLRHCIWKPANRRTWKRGRSLINTLN